MNTDYADINDLDNCCDDDNEAYGPEHDDYIVTDARRGGYDVSQSGKFLTHVVEMDDARLFIETHKERNQYWPDAWYVTDRGDVSILNF